MALITAPTPGRIVYYTDNDGAVWPAVVVVVRDLDDVELAVYVSRSTTDVIGARYQAHGARGSWRWPPEASSTLDVDDATGLVVGVA
mgnify:CR=1 FL=1|tara:strand:- start:340 stop:600 length:261 start_codon:yes stop_codon:yes gene_type:complete